jgi:glycosyltransferase involved in cell wall biosynthesis
VTLLFTSSRQPTAESFFGRGGVDALNAFLTLAKHRPWLRLLVRTGLPPNISDRLMDEILNHPQIEWYPDRLDWSEYRRLFERADIYLLPAVTAYRNGLVQARQWSVVPVVSDGAHMREMVQDGITGVIVKGRRSVSNLNTSNGRFVQDWVSILQANDQPADPAFFQKYVAALGELVDNRPLLRRLQENCLRHEDTTMMSAEDVYRFEDILSMACDL